MSTRQSFYLKTLVALIWWWALPLFCAWVMLWQNPARTEKLIMSAVIAGMLPMTILSVALIDGHRSTRLRYRRTRVNLRLTGLTVQCDLFWGGPLTGMLLVMLYVGLAS